MRKKQKGNGFLEDVDKFLKQSKILSTVGNVLLPAAGGALGGLVTANPLGATAGGALGTSANQWLKSQGYGYKYNLSQLGSGNNTSLQGYTISYNGTYQPIPGRMKGSGQNSAYGSLSSDFGKIKV